MVSAPVYDKSDAKIQQTYPFHLPISPEWSEYKDWYSQTAMTSAGAGMFIKQPLIIWSSLILAVVGYVNQQPLRAPKDANSPLLVLGMAFAGIITGLFPKMTLAPEVIETPVPAQ
ncbi:hypothetical protein IAT40_006340 [Kwoniella sp. CBS 6097]